MLKDGQLCSPGAVSDGGHPMLTEALNGVSYNNLGNSSSVSPSAFTKRQALCQFINVAYILLLTSVALDKFTTSSRDNISISAPQTYLAAVSLSEVVTLGVVLGVTAEPMQQFTGYLFGSERKSREQAISGSLGLICGYSVFASVVQFGGLYLSLDDPMNVLVMGSIGAWLASATMISMVLFGEREWGLRSLFTKALPPSLAFNTFVVLNTFYGVELAPLSALAGGVVSVFAEALVEHHSERGVCSNSISSQTATV